MSSPAASRIANTRVFPIPKARLRDDTRAPPPTRCIRPLTTPCIPYSAGTVSVRATAQQQQQQPCRCPAVRLPANRTCSKKQRKLWLSPSFRPLPGFPLSHHVRRDGKRDQVDQWPQPPRAEREGRQAVRRPPIHAFRHSLLPAPFVPCPSPIRHRLPSSPLTCLPGSPQTRHRGRPHHLPQLLEPRDLLHRRRVRPRRGCLYRPVYRHRRRQRGAYGASDHDLGVPDSQV